MNNQENDLIRQAFNQYRDSLLEESCELDDNADCLIFREGAKWAAKRILDLCDENYESIVAPDEPTKAYSPKHQLCIHGQWGHEGCASCLEIAIQKLVNTW